VDGAAVSGEDLSEEIRRLEAENEALRAANAKLARERVGTSNTAAASRLAHGGSQPGGRSLADRLLAPLRALRLLLRRIALRALR
jgi:hypothetical protein